MQQYTEETYFFDYSNEAIQAVVKPFRELDLKEKIAGVFEKVRDNWRYNPNVIYMHKENYRASFIASNPEGHCIDKSTLFIAAMRALEIPARLRLAKVANHIAVEHLTDKFGSHYLAPHGIAEIFVDGAWRKASTAFNTSLCDRYNVDVLEFDGSEDAVFQSYNRDNNKFMEYVEDYGAFDDVPVDFIKETFLKNYPSIEKTVKGKDKVIL